MSPHQESRDPPFSSLGNIVKIRIQTQSTSRMSDQEKVYSESYSDIGIPELRQKPTTKGPKPCRESGGGVGQGQEAQIRGYGGQYRVQQ